MAVDRIEIWDFFFVAMLLHRFK